MWDAAIFRQRLICSLDWVPLDIDRGVAVFFSSYPNELLSPFCLSASHDCVTAEMDNKVVMSLTFSVSLKASDARLSSSFTLGFHKTTLGARTIIYDKWTLHNIS